MVNQTMSRQLEASRERETLPIVDLKVHIHGSAPLADPSEEQDGANVVPPPVVVGAQKPMHVVLNPQTVLPLTSLLDAIGQYNTRTLAWKFKPRALVATPLATTAPATPSTPASIASPSMSPAQSPSPGASNINNNPLAVIFVRPIGVHDVFGQYELSLIHI